MPRTKHGMHKSAEYRRWVYMKMRCAKDPRYIAKGITVCERWLHDFAAFFEDMGELPSKRHTLDRIDGARGYSPDNCRWATYAEQNRNLATNKWIDGELQGDIARRAGVHRNTVAYRNRVGVSLDAPPINERATCKKGHAWTEENTYMREVNHKGKKRIAKYCRACRAQHQADLRNRRK